MACLSNATPPNFRSMLGLTEAVPNAIMSACPYAAVANFMNLFASCSSEVVGGDGAKTALSSDDPASWDSTKSSFASFRCTAPSSARLTGSGLLRFLKFVSVERRSASLATTSVDSLHRAKILAVRADMDVRTRNAAPRAVGMDTAAVIPQCPEVSLKVIPLEMANAAAPARAGGAMVLHRSRRSPPPPSPPPPRDCGAFACAGRGDVAMAPQLGLGEG